MAENIKPAYNVSDGGVVITVSSDSSVAFMIIYAPKGGGKPVTYDDAIRALYAKGVTANIHEELIRKAIENNVFEREFRAAESIPPVDGEDGKIEFLYSKENTFVPVEDENGFVDYKNVGFIKNIHENDVIANITLPTEGIHGSDIRGNSIPAISGKRVSYTLGKGTKLSEDGTKVLAACDGHIFFTHDSFCVDSVVTISGDVDASVGNLDFFGDIVIKGNIMEGFSVVSGKSITVSGNATNAVIKAGESVTVKQGIINSNIVSHGDIECGFCEYSNLRTDGSITGQSFVMSTLYCGGDLNAKTVTGGSITILGNAEIAHSIGSKNFMATEIIMGDIAVLGKERDALCKQINECTEKIDRCNQILSFLAQKNKELGGLPQDKVELLAATAQSRTECTEQQEQASKRIEEINRALSEQQERTLACRGHIYPGVDITINSASQKVKSEMVRVMLFVDEAGLIATRPIN